MTKEEAKEQLWKSEIAARKAGELWGKKAMHKVLNEKEKLKKMITLNQEDSGNSTWQGKSQPMSLSELAKKTSQKMGNQQKSNEQ